jgi:hypothetical protein
VHNRKTYKATRNEIERVHKTKFSEYILSRKPSFPEGFSEFNALGNAALNTLCEEYEIHNTDQLGYPVQHMAQFWSKKPIDESQDVWINHKLITTSGTCFSHDIHIA